MSTSSPKAQLDLEDETLAQLDIVVASVHSHSSTQPIGEIMTARVLRALENPYVRILGHPTGRKLLETRTVSRSTWKGMFKRAAANWVSQWSIMPLRPAPTSPTRNMRLAKSLGCKIIMDTDAHAISTSSTTWQDGDHPASACMAYGC